MKLRTLALGAVAAGLMAAPSIAEAWTGQTTGTVNMRTDAYVGAGKITTLPAGTHVEVIGQKNGWYRVAIGNTVGYVSGSYAAQSRVAMYQNPRFMGPGPGFRRGPAPTFGFYKKPYWDNQHQAWYDGRRWYRNGVWYNSPNGFSFGFSFGG